MSTYRRKSFYNSKYCTYATQGYSDYKNTCLLISHQLFPEGLQKISNFEPCLVTVTKHGSKFEQ